MTVGDPADLLDLWPAHSTSRVIHDDRSCVEADMLRLTESTADELARCGAGPGDIVAWQLSNSIESVSLFRACWELEAIAAPLHHRAGSSEVADLLTRLSPAVFVDANGVRAQLASERSTRHLADSAAVVLHTSGSSGTPKGVVHTHASLMGKALQMAVVHALSSDDVVLMPAPFAHVSGLLNGILVPGAAGMTTVLMDRWDPEYALDLIEAHRVSFMVGPPTFFLGMRAASGFEPERVQSLRLLSVGGAGVTPQFVATAETDFAAVVKRTYGSTEAPTVTTSLNDDSLEVRSNTDGRASGTTCVRTVDPRTSIDCAAGEPGEVWVSGPEIFAGYIDERSNAEVMVVDGGARWFRTGDLGVLDAHGHLCITGRLGEVIIRGGENIAPAEIEAQLMAHPHVCQAVVMGEPDELMGERVVAVLQPESADDSDPGGKDLLDTAVLREWLTDKGLAGFKTPERVLLLDAMPMLDSGKPDRQAVRRMLGSRS